MGGQAGTPDCSEIGPSCATGQLCNSESCCTSLPVPGGSYRIDASELCPASVSPFCLDRYEVTVGRFRAFVSSYDAWRAAGNPLEGAGAHPHVPGSGWQPAWSEQLPVSAQEFQDQGHLRHTAVSNTWDGVEDQPIANVTWLEAFAFCIWDQARLPTAAEWEYAAGHGDENRIYPWGDTPQPSIAVADIACAYDGEPDCSVWDIASVGSFPAGRGFFGHDDMAGSLWEWVLDEGSQACPIQPCNDCAYLSTGSSRMIRGGSFYNSDDARRFEVRFRVSAPPNDHAYDLVGVRCAR